MINFTRIISTGTFCYTGPSNRCPEPTWDCIDWDCGRVCSRFARRSLFAQNVPVARLWSLAVRADFFGRAFSHDFPTIFRVFLLNDLFLGCHFEWISLVFFKFFFGAKFSQSEANLTWIPYLDVICYYFIKPSRGSFKFLFPFLLNVRVVFSIVIQTKWFYQASSDRSSFYHPSWLCVRRTPRASKYRILWHLVFISQHPKTPVKFHSGQLTGPRSIDDRLYRCLRLNSFGWDRKFGGVRTLLACHLELFCKQWSPSKIRKVSAAARQKRIGCVCALCVWCLFYCCFFYCVYHECANSQIQHTKCLQQQQLEQIMNKYEEKINDYRIKPKRPKKLVCVCVYVIMDWE